MKKTESIFGERLRRLREKRGLTQLDLAKIFDIDKQRISKYELGQRQMDDETKILFADFFNVTIDYLLGRTNNMEPQTPHTQPPISCKERETLEKLKNLPPVRRKAIELLINEDEEEIKSKHG